MAVSSKEKIQNYIKRGDVVVMWHLFGILGPP